MSPSFVPPLKKHIFSNAKKLTHTETAALFKCFHCRAQSPRYVCQRCDVAPFCRPECQKATGKITKLCAAKQEISTLWRSSRPGQLLQAQTTLSSISHCFEWFYLRTESSRQSIQCDMNLHEEVVHAVSVAQKAIGSINILYAKKTFAILEDAIRQDAFGENKFWLASQGSLARQLVIRRYHGIRQKAMVKLRAYSARSSVMPVQKPGQVEWREENE